jgi:mannose-6-phosphate isomerase-like protein (cupin superfamily)
MKGVTMTGFVQNIEQATILNPHFRQVLFTGQHAQVVVMTLQANEDIGEEVHDIVDQFLRIESGEGTIVMNGEQQSVKAGDAIVVPAGTKHNLINASAQNPLKLYTVYAPPHHKDGTVHATKKDAQQDKEDYL